MPFQLKHFLFLETFKPVKHTEGELASFRVALAGTFPALFTGRLIRRAVATFTHRVRVDAVGAEEGVGGSGGGTGPLHGGFQTINKTIPLDFRIFSPDGREFTSQEITPADLRRFRDRRGSPSGPWKWSLRGRSADIFVDEDSSITNAKGTVGLDLLETVPSASAPPLVPKTRIAAGLQSFQFDLFRVGTFVAEVSRAGLGLPWRGRMQLFDPDGTVVASTRRGRLTFDVELATLGRSRDAAGRARPWRLDVSSQGGSLLGTPRVTATVIGRGRISIDALTTRINALLGPQGQFIELFGENRGGDALARLRVTDVVSAETIDMHGLLEDILRDVEQDGGVNPNDFQANVVYTLARRSEKLKAGLKLVVNSLRAGPIDVAIGPGAMLTASVPAIRLTITVTGAVRVKFGPATLATAKVRGGKLAFEIGIKLSPDGTPQIVTAMKDSPFDIDISTAVKAALMATLGAAGLIGGMSVTEYVEHEVNEFVVASAKRLFAEPTIAPRILMTIFGAHLTYQPFRIEGDEVVFDHIAPIEPEPKPTPGYHGSIGRSFSEVGPGQVRFRPALLGDTWRADNLASKIDHIVVVMMENRSYDHVLGYRARPPFNDGADGLTEETIAAIEGAPEGPFDVRNLNTAGFPPNAVGRMTRLPKGVGHELDDVREQLSVRTAGPNGAGVINSPKGFVENFRPRLSSNPQGVVTDDVLGFYDEVELPFFAYLAENYAYCDRYFCSHPGPTLPNRMYSLTGDVQHDRHGFPILENNDGDNFILSRAPTIYDLLARRGIGFRVYESQPSVTMLRFFARYATDTVNIVALDRLEQDVASGNLPAFTAIEPQMHAHPQDDDHPDADMHRGQLFIKRVYDALTSNPSLWARTLLLITYDEHGGLYDHVVPPTADVYGPSRPHLAVDVGDLPALQPATPTGDPVRPTLTHPALGHAGAGAAVLGSVLVSAPAVPATTAPQPALLAVPYGVRVPTFVVSPWTSRGKGPRVTLDHCSILKTVLARFLGAEKPFLSDRVSASHSFEAFLTEPSPRMDVPPFTGSLPPLPLDVRRAVGTTTATITPPLSRKAMRTGPVDYHELSGRWARQLGR